MARGEEKVNMFILGFFKGDYLRFYYHNYPRKFPTKAVCELYQIKQTELQKRRCAQKERFALERERDKEEYQEIVDKHERNVVLLKRRQDLEKPEAEINGSNNDGGESRAKKRKRQRNKDRGKQPQPAAMRQFKAKLRVRISFYLNLCCFF